MFKYTEELDSFQIGDNSIEMIAAVVRVEPPVKRKN